ncbi:PTS system mannose/fructose/N-acetylgalactosamine-transporter subunit IIB [Pelosinus propionicus]|uniref:PTS system, mannose-specific IIB component n=1 Tax=Pelosinus propionicus DSM 13327 TaxID=1123291 RepID=A0A1I4IYK8_9FIRM|nr:PTS sugar transporter subunit IIB [Pelosinus propionicus]SFL58856.1 PTS system, mannose-specific IIB component [Pelosinus propionicus DSM 13327]
MLHIVLTRIDDRLIHGQVITAWTKITKADRIIVVDDEVAEDSFMVKVLKMAAPSSIKVDIFNTEDAAVTLAGEDIGERVIILVKTPKTVLGLIKAGVNIADLNLGGMGATQGRKQLYRNISISAEEKAIFKELLTLGVDVFVQIVPDANKMPMAAMI